MGEVGGKIGDEEFEISPVEFVTAGIVGPRRTHVTRNPWKFRLALKIIKLSTCTIQQTVSSPAHHLSCTDSLFVSTRHPIPSKVQIVRSQRHDRVSAGQRVTVSYFGYFSSNAINTYGAIRKKCAVVPENAGISLTQEPRFEANSPLYHPSGPSVFSVFHKQSSGLEYSTPTSLPLGSARVGWLYMRVRALCHVSHHPE